MKLGGKPKLTPEQVALALRLVDEGQLVETSGMHETTIHRHVSATAAAAQVPPPTRIPSE